MTEQEIKNADLDNSGSLNKADSFILGKIRAGWELKLPIKLGDINVDGIIDMKDVTMLDQYIAGDIELETQSSINADINVDENIDEYDLEIIRQYITNHNYDSGTDISIKPVIYGDVSGDGKLDMKDVVKLNKYFLEGELLFIENMLNADVNADGIVNNYDLRILKEYIAEYDYDLMKEPFDFPVLCGDVNFDGVINTLDRLFVARYVAGMLSFTGAQEVVADVNVDGKVDTLDQVILQRYCAKWNGYEKLPVTDVDIDIKDEGESISVLFGDANCDGKVDSSDITLIQNYVKNSGNISDLGRINSDVNLDGTINLLDSNLINLFLEDKITLPVKYGDLNKDGVADAGDAGLISQFAEDMRDFTDQEKVIADVNADGKVNHYDAVLISRFDVGFIKLPYLMGDVNEDGKINNKDATRILQYSCGVREFDEQQCILADVNLDGLINNLDAELILQYVSGWSVSLPIIYGDVDGNGKLDNRDFTMIMEYTNGSCTFDEGQKYIADVNLDGKVNNKDLELVQQCINGTITLPQAFIKNEEVKKDILGNKEIIKGFEIGENGAKVSEVIKSFTDNVETVVYDKKYQEIDSTKVVGTGYTIENYLDNEELPNQEYVVIVYGDTTGDGLITPVDALAIIKNRNEKVLFTSEFYNEAGRILTENKEETPSALDALAVIKHLNGKYTINQSK